MVDDGKKNGLLPMVTEIVAAHLSNNTVTMTEIPRLINEVYAALSNLGQASSKPAERQEPAIPLKKSVTADYIVCLEDGKKLKMLKRYIMKRYGLTPDAYRAKWALPADYPMVAPNYAKKRSAMAVKLGLGRKKKGA